MTTVPEKTKEIVLGSNFYRKGISEGVINLSSLARIIKPDIEKALLKDVSEASVVMALKRISADLTYDKKVDFKTHFGDVTLKSDLIEFTYKNSEDLYKKMENLLAQLEKYEDIYLTFVKGVWQTTIIASSSIKNPIEKMFKEETLQSSYGNLSSITVKLVNNHIAQPGIIAFALDTLAWMGVNIVEVVSTFDELTVIIEKESVVKAFEVINNLKI